MSRTLLRDVTVLELLACGLTVVLVLDGGAPLYSSALIRKRGRDYTPYRGGFLVYVRARARRAAPRGRRARTTRTTV